MKGKSLPHLSPEIAARFWSKVDVRQPTECWLWEAAKVHNGYGVFRLRQGPVYAHRVAYQLLIGDVPVGETQLDHLCRVRHCVNPAHLEIVTPKENFQRGETNATKTHCKNDHEFTPTNTYMHGSRRECIACRRIRQQGYNSKYRSSEYQPKSLR